MGLLTKIFGNADSGVEAAVERPEGHRDSEVRSADVGEQVQTRDADPGSSGIRPAVDATVHAAGESAAALPHEGTRPPGASRRPEHPRMYLRPTPVRIDPSVPGSTRRPQIALRPTTGKESGAGLGPREGVTPKRTSELQQIPVRALEPAMTPEIAPAMTAAITPEATPVRSTRTPPTGNHPKPVMVVSPVSLTAEELQLQAGTRPKMQTLMGLGMGIGVEVVPDSPSQLPSSLELRAPGSLALRAPGSLEPRAPEESRVTPVASTQSERRIMRELFASLDGLLPAQRWHLEREMTLEALARTTPEVLATKLRAPIERAQALSELVEKYVQERQTRASTDSLQALASATEALAERARELDEHDEDQDAEQRLARLRKRAALTRVNLLLAERGELDLLDVLEPCATAERLERLREWLGTDGAHSGAVSSSTPRQS